MSKVLDLLADFAAGVSATEMAILCGLVAAMVGGLALPRILGMRSRRDFQARDDEYQRLQKM